MYKGTIIGVTIFLLTPILSSSQETTATLDDPMLKGKILRIDLLDAPYGTWFKENFNAYAVDKNMAETFRDALTDLDIVIFLGTWCSDSKREVPKIFKILDYLAIPPERIRLVAVDRDKISPDQDEEGFNIHHVPTVIFYLEGIEMGRFIEEPFGSLEKDFADILLGEPYIPRYEGQY